MTLVFPNTNPVALRANRRIEEPSIGNSARNQFALDRSWPGGDATPDDRRIERAQSARCPVASNLNRKARRGGSPLCALIPAGASALENRSKAGCHRSPGRPTPKFAGPSGREILPATTNKKAGLNPGGTERCSATASCNRLRAGTKFVRSKLVCCLRG